VVLGVATLVDFVVLVVFTVVRVVPLLFTFVSTVVEGVVVFTVVETRVGVPSFTVVEEVRLVFEFVLVDVVVWLVLVGVVV
jgi:hypothetical protein